MKNSLRIHLCSSNRDLASERHSLLNLFEDMRVRTPGFTFFGSRSLPSIEVACDDIASADVVVLVVGHLYGMIAPGLNRSQEEREFDEARRLGKTILVFIRDEDSARVPGSVEKDPSKLPLLTDFRKRLIEEYPVQYFKDIADITALVEDEVLKLFQSRQMVRRPSSKSGHRIRYAPSDSDKGLPTTESPGPALSQEASTKTLPVLQKALSTPFSPSTEPRGKKIIVAAASLFLLLGLAWGIWKGQLLQKLKVQTQKTETLANDPTSMDQVLDTLTFDSTATLVNQVISTAPPIEVAQAPDPLAMLFEKAKEGDSLSLFRLGTMYDSGITLPQDDSMASTHYRKAASKGMPEAQYRLALRHLEGKGTKRSKSLAVFWLQAAANQDYPAAQSKLGIMYLYGQGVIKDQVQAMKWLLRASDQNDPIAQKTLDEIKSR